jgi:UDP:flavonoid glycosyltransferase YjiC (YdhE family)
MLHVDYAPFSELLPRCAALLHHCGIGTTAQVLAAGIPHIAMPMAHDQADNADRLLKLGVAHVVPARKLTANTATAAIGDVLSNQAMQQRAREVSRRFENSDPLRASADVIESVAAGRVYSEAVIPARKAGRPSR